jgi:hypothetical protein
MRFTPQSIHFLHILETTDLIHELLLAASIGMTADDARADHWHSFSY